LIGIGSAFQGATGNGYVAALKRNGERKMGILHAAYGCGAFVAPLISTQFAELTGRKWAWVYIGESRRLFVQTKQLTWPASHDVYRCQYERRSEPRVPLQTRRT